MCSMRHGDWPLYLPLVDADEQWEVMQALAAPISAASGCECPGLCRCPGQEEICAHAFYFFDDDGTRVCEDCYVPLDDADAG